MQITDEMVKVAVVKSVEAGLLPRRALKEDFDDAQEMMRTILQSTLEGTSAAERSAMHQDSAQSSDGRGSSRKARFIPAELQNFY